MTNKPTTVQVSTNTNRQLTLISTFTGVNKNEILENFIDALFWRCVPYFQNSISTGDLITYNLEVSAKPHTDLVKGSYICDMDASEEETSKKTFALIKEQLANLDFERAERKKRFKEVFDREIPSQKEG